jgi:hypothetical protein
MGATVIQVHWQTMPTRRNVDRVKGTVNGGGCEEGGDGDDANHGRPNEPQHTATE